MQLSTSSSQALDAWINRETWYTSHPLDQQRLDAFKRSLQEEEEGFINLESLIVEIKQRKEAKGAALNSNMEKILRAKLADVGGGI